MEKILIVEDDDKIARVIQLELEYEGYEVAIAYTGKEAMEKYGAESFDMILLDVMIPELNGLEVLRRVRQKDDEIRIIMLTARDAVMDKVSGLDSGANDYVTKPFEIEELLARIRAQLKQRSLSNNADFQEMKYRHLKILPMAREVYIDDELIYLTQREYDLLHFLVEHKTRHYHGSRSSRRCGVMTIMVIRILSMSMSDTCARNSIANPLPSFQVSGVLAI